MFRSIALLCPPVLSRHLLRAFLRAAGLCLGAFLAIAIIVDFFDRFDGFLQHGASVGTILRYFLFKAPTYVTQVAPIAILAGVLLGLGGLGRHNEFVALRTAGVSIWQMATVLLITGAIISGFIFFWNEQVIPYCAHRAHDIYTVEIKHRGSRGIAGRRHVWYRGHAGFYNIKHVDIGENILAGLTIFQMGPGFRPRRLIQVDRASWDGHEWQLFGVRGYRLRADGSVESDMAVSFKLPESPRDFLAFHRDAEEFSFAGLRRHIKELRSKGAHAGVYLVDLQLKLALPFVGLVMMMIGIPVATKGSRATNAAGAVAFGLAIGFGYFVVLAFSRALGQGGALQPVLAAWIANGIFGLIGVFLLLGTE